MHPILYILSFAFFVATLYAIVRKRSEQWFVHILGLLFISSIVAALFQAMGTFMVFSGSLIVPCAK